MEQVYHVTPDDMVIGPLERDRAHSEGLLHRSGMVFLSRPDGRVLVQHRSSRKKTFPDRRDASCAFHVSYGESYEDAARRELAEECGLSASLRLVAKFVHRDPPEYQIVAVFVGQSDSPVRVDPDESVGAEFLSREEIDDVVRGGRITPWLRDGWPLVRARL
jgi:isopentenyldiphosphate isomerase